METVLSLTSGLPEVTFAPGDVIVSEGTQTGAIWILVSGALSVRRGDVFVNQVIQPGAIIGQISVLLDQPHGATVEATEPTRMRHAVDGRALLDAHPGFGTLVAADLASRLDALTIYLADLKTQYGAAPGLSMVSDVLSQLSAQPLQATRPVSARDPEPDY